MSESVAKSNAIEPVALVVPVEILQAASRQLKHLFWGRSLG